MPRSHPEKKEQLAKALEAHRRSRCAVAISRDGADRERQPQARRRCKGTPAPDGISRPRQVNAAQALLEIGKAKEAGALVGVFASDPVWAKSTQRADGLLALGEAQIASTTSPQPSPRSRNRALQSARHGPGAQYFLARILQETGERPEAVIAYEGVFKGYLEQRRKAEDA